MHVQYIRTCGNLKNHIRSCLDTNEVPEPVGLDGGHLSQTERGIGSHDRQVLQQGGLREGSQSLQRFDGFLVADGQGGTFGVEPGLQSRKINLIHHGDQHVVQVVRPGFKLYLKGGFNGASESWNRSQREGQSRKGRCNGLIHIRGLHNLI